MNKTLNTLAPFAKAILAFLVAFAGTAATAAADGSIVYAEWWMIVATALTALAGVYGIPNKDDAGEHQDESVQPPRHYDYDGDGYAG